MYYYFTSYLGQGYLPGTYMTRTTVPQLGSIPEPGLCCSPSHFRSRTRLPTDNKDCDIIIYPPDHLHYSSQVDRFEIQVGG